MSVVGHNDRSVLAHVRLGDKGHVVGRLEEAGGDNAPSRLLGAMVIHDVGDLADRDAVLVNDLMTAEMRVIRKFEWY